MTPVVNVTGGVMLRQLRFNFPAGLYFGDNLDVLREIDDEMVDLVYLDPPFNSNQTYNIFLRASGTPVAAQIRAFDDTWRWSIESERTYKADR